MDSEGKATIRKVIYTFICILGTIIQLIFCFEAYFAYTVITDFDVTHIDTISPPSLVICLNVSDVYGRGGNARTPIPNNWIEAMTIDELLSLSPKGRELVIGGIIPPNKHLNDHYDVLSSTKELFKSRRFLKRQNLCFTFTPKDMTTYTRRTLIDKWKIRQLYIIQLDNRWFSPNASVDVFFNWRNRMFYDKTDSHTTIVRKGTIKGSVMDVQPSDILLSYAQYISKLLPSPYQSHCRDYSEMGFFESEQRWTRIESRSHCYDTCARKGLNSLNFSSVEVYSESGDSPFLSGQHVVMNPILKFSIDKITKKCKKLCKKLDCLDIQYVPKEVSISKGSNGSVMKISVNIPTDPDYKVTTKPLLSLVDFITYVLSVISFWTGLAPLSFMSDFDPFLWVWKSLELMFCRRKQQQSTSKADLLAKRIDEIDITDRSLSFKVYLSLVEEWFQETKQEIEQVIETNRLDPSIILQRKRSSVKVPTPTSSVEESPSKHSRRTSYPRRCSLWNDRHRRLSVQVQDPLTTIPKDMRRLSVQDIQTSRWKTTPQNRY